MCGSEKEPMGRLIYFMAQEIGNFAEKLLKPYGLTLEQLHLLKSVATQSGMTQKEIGQAINKSPANLTRILDRLQEKSLVERRSSPEDRRAFRVFITDNGKDLVSQVIELFDSFSHHFLDGVSDREQQIIRESFAKMAKNLQKMATVFNDSGTMEINKRGEACE